MIQIQSNKIIPFFLLLASITFVINCTQSGDGPMEVDPNNQLRGSGFYLGAQFDSGRNYISRGDTLHLLIDSLYLLSDCSLDSVIFRNSDQNLSTGIRRTFYADFEQGSSTSINCASRGIQNDSLFHIFLSSAWNDVQEVIIFGWTEDTSGAVFVDTTGLDSIYIRDGKKIDSTFIFSRDSLNWPTDSFADPGIRRRLLSESITPKILFRKEVHCLDSKLYPDCIDIQDSADFTLGPFRDTIVRTLNYLCRGSDSLYCPVADRDTISATLDSIPFQDTTRYYHELYVETLSDCDFNNLFQVQSYLANNSSAIVIRRELFHMNQQTDCQEKSHKFVWELAADTLVTDPSKLVNF